MEWVRSHLVLSAVGFLLVLGILLVVVAGGKKQNDLTTTTVETGSVSEVVSVSGTVEATKEATLAFPTSGIIAGISIERGSEVLAGEILATIGDSAVAADRAQAAAAVAAAVAARDELVSGQTAESAQVTQTTVANAEAALVRAQELAREQVGTALAALLSNDLEAFSTDPDEQAAAPTVSGTYTCAEEGSYRLFLFGTDTDSGYSYRLEGLENGTFAASVNQPAPLGSCGLFIQFVAGEKYVWSEWEITVPNKRSATYITRKNAYDLALTQAEQNVQAARDTLALATNQASVETAAPRVESLVAANAAVQEAQARLQRIDAQLTDFAITAPFAGVVTDVLVNPGEVANQQPAINLLSTEAYELVARVPEIDVTKLAVGQSITAVFDAKRDEIVPGTIEFVTPEAIEIDGVGYFEAVITLSPTPDWLRAGLNADVDIIVHEEQNTTRLPQRFIDRSTEPPTVQIYHDGELVTQPVELGLIGNDGFIEVRNLEVGETVVAP
ncbi:hypothetical protein CL655_03180 [bacterium]|nr:hypothetical protein [bacterium]|tara:strand:- start:3113 stop:4612 length:1500 start_codon:yes stop_codon:yes gene_type:complete